MLDDGRHGGRVAGAVGEEDAVGAAGEHLGSAVTSRRAPRPPGSRRRPARVAMLSFIPQSMATTRGPSSPSGRGAAGGLGRQVAAVEHRVLAHPRQQLLGAELGRRRRRAWRRGRAGGAPGGGCRSPRRPPRRARQPRAPAGRAAGAGGVAGAGHDHGARPGAVALVVPRAGAVVADHRRGEAEDLPEVRRVGDRLLVAGHPGGEDHLAERGARRAARSAASRTRPSSRTTPGAVRHRTSCEIALNSSVPARSSISNSAISAEVVPRRRRPSSPGRRRGCTACATRPRRPRRARWSRGRAGRGRSG